MDAKTKAVAIAALRKTWLRSPQRTIAKKKAFVDRGMYKCSVCDAVVHYKELEIDHIEPCVPLDGWCGFDTFIERLFEGPLRAVCKPCHKGITDKQKEVRKANKPAKPKKEKK